MFQGVSLTKVGIKPLYSAIGPSYWIVYRRKDENMNYKIIIEWLLKVCSKTFLFVFFFKGGGGGG